MITRLADYTRLHYMNTLNQSEGAWMGSIFKEVQNLDFGLSILDFSQGTVSVL